ncbi:hypothetical protein [Streptomyces indicus]|uniref:Uncharacterized protein n=1 Tax=Streptomyces indicus TaxID=417292 RepID=A0A1G9G8U4_9ACTN|nr:hypothetical protein [Streptomyces indicus]SDK97148.1 hypothetical protein SAMN05421806_11558 [Streptomyces indicus]
MTHTRNSSPRAGRAFLVAVTFAGLAAVPASAMDYGSTTGTPAPAPEAAAAPRPAGERPPGPVLDGDPGTPATRVAHFYAAYTDVAAAPGSNETAKALRSFYLTPALQQRLADWERRNEADGVLRAQNSPTAWRVTPEGSGMGSTWATVRLTWGEGQDRRYTYLKVTTQLESGKISDITEKY